MLSTGVPLTARRGQIPLAIITFFSCGLSFWLTVRLCGTLAPGHACLELVAMGVAWELAKLTFGSLGAQRLRGDAGARACGQALVGVSLILAAGSIVASLAFLMQTEEHIAQQARHAAKQALHASQAYAREAAALEALDGEIQATLTLAEQYRDQGLLTRSDRTMGRIGTLRRERLARAQTLSEREADIGLPAAASAGSGFFAGESARRPAAQCVLAVMLEVIGMVALSLLCSPKVQATGGSSAAGGPALHVLYPATAAVAASDAASHRHRCNAPATPDSRDTDNDAGSDAGGLVTTLHRDAPAHRTDAHRSTGGAAAMPADGKDASTDVIQMQQACVARAASPVRSRCRDARQLQALYEQARQMLCSAQLRPRYRDMQRVLGVSQFVVQRFLARLVAEGVLCRKGSAYVPTRIAVAGGVA